MQRLFSKIAANMLLSHVQSLLHQNQTEFLKEINILECFHYAREVIQLAIRQKKQIVIFKTDIYKTFDSIGWNFLIKCMQLKGLSQILIEWIRHLILQKNQN